MSNQITIRAELLPGGGVRVRALGFGLQVTPKQAGLLLGNIAAAAGRIGERIAGSEPDHVTAVEEGFVAGLHSQQMDGIAGVIIKPITNERRAS